MGEQRKELQLHWGGEEIAQRMIPEAKRLYLSEVQPPLLCMYVPINHVGQGKEIKVDILYNVVLVNHPYMYVCIYYTCICVYLAIHILHHCYIL